MKPDRKELKKLLDGSYTEWQVAKRINTSIHDLYIWINKYNLDANFTFVNSNKTRARNLLAKGWVISEVAKELRMETKDILEIYMTMKRK